MNIVFAIAQTARRSGATNHTMRQLSLSVPELALIAGTRAAAGAGLALLLGDRLKPEQRRAIGWTLLAVGIVTTIPLVAEVFGKRQPGA